MKDNLEVLSISISPPAACEKDVNSVETDITPNKPSPSFPSISEIEEHKRKLLGKLDTFVQSGMMNPDDESNVIQSDKGEKILDSSLEPTHKKRKRRKKKSKRKEETKTVVRVEDKPRSSVLNLPWDMQPQNLIIKFESDSDDCLQKNVKNDDAKLDDKDKKKMDEAKEDTNDLPVKINGCIEDVMKSSENSLESQAKSASKRYKDLTPTCRKYLMRSTVGILDSLRSNSSAIPSTNLSATINLPVKGFEESRSGPSLQKKSVVTSRIANESVQFTINDAAVDKSNSELFAVPESLIEKHSHHQTSNVNPEGKFNQLHQQKAAAPPGFHLEKLNASSTPHNISVDPEARFVELLQRRKLSSTSCSVSRSENGVTVCTRHKSQKGNPGAQLNSFANPATDVLTNVSIIKKFNGNDNLPGAASQKSETCGNIAVKTFVGRKDVNNVSGKVEVIPLDVENCPPLSGDPCTGDILAYKILEMNLDYTPVVSDFKTGKVLSSQDGILTLKLFGSAAPKRPKGKFDLVYEDEEETTENALTEEQVLVPFTSMFDARLVQRYSDVTKEG